MARTPTRTPSRAAVAAPQPAAAELSELAELADRVRAWRARRGMTRRQLATDSGLSERFLADMESGRGNPSVQSLAAVARALHLSAADLLQDPPPAQLAHLQALLGRLDEAQLERARDWLDAQFGQGRGSGRERRIALVGLRGAGKSTLGARLAAERGLPFVELDREIEREGGTSISEILLLHGQAGFRRLERRALSRVADSHPDGVVLTTGGSLVSERDTFELLLARFWCVWVKTSPEEHMSRVVAQGDLRPFDVTQGATREALEDIRRILASREPLYARADAVVDTASRSVAQSLADLKRAMPPRRRGAAR